jgi:peptide/nickel transport system substrate-binding protein
LLITRGRFSKSLGDSSAGKKVPSRLKSKFFAVGAGLVIAGVALSGCTSGGSSSGASGPGKSADTATFALPPATVPNFIWPFSPLANYSVINSGALQQLMYRPLYWFGDNKGQPLINPGLSLADQPVISNGGKTVTVKLKPYKWSNGETVTAQDVEFWVNMEKAEKANYAAYVPGQFPDNLTSVTTPNSSTIVFNTDKVYSQQWFLYNQLSQITPMPTAWDKTSATTNGTCATDVSGCAAVYKYLNAQAKDLPTYVTSKIWSVVDGPWKLSTFNADGRDSFVPNPSYSGPTKATLKKFILAPYTTDTSEFNVLHTGQTIDVGYIPTQDISQPKSASSGPAEAGPNPLKNYDLVPQFLYGINYFPYNFNNPTVGPIFKQLYFRQAMQSVVDQDSIIKSTAKNYGVPTTGPIPLYPSSPLVSSTEKNNPYPFSLSKASSLLTAHGWKVVAGGSTTCVKPGTASDECGTGITAGEALTFNLPYASGNATIDVGMQSLKSNASKVGITLNLAQQPFNTVIGAAVPCKPTDATCSWQMANWGGGWVYANDYYPTGESLFETGAGSNSGSYSNPDMDKLINDTNTESGTPVLQTYENALAKDLPVVWQPNYTYSLTEIASGLKGVTPQSAFGLLTPEQWHW